MKDSGIEWIGDIPEEWQLDKGKAIFRQRNERGNNIELQILSPSQKLGVVPQSLLEERTGHIAVKVKEETDLRAFKTIHKGDFCISLRSFQGGFEYSAYEGVVSPAYQVFYPIKSISDRFYRYIFKIQPFIDKMCSYTMTLRDGKNISFSDFGNSYIPYPPLTVQYRIADFLDDECAKIDRLIAHEQATIDELKAYKQSVITEAVTKGLDKSAPMKDSGVEWIGEIPKRWEIKRAKYIATFIFKGNGITKEDIVVDGDTPCVRYGEIYSKYNISFRQCETRTNKSNLSVLQYFNYGDILFAGTGELVEEIGKNIVYLGETECLAGGDIVVLRHKQNPVFLNYALYATHSQMQKSCGKAKLKVVHISASEIGNIYVALPPIEEQKQIADYLDKKCADIDSLISIKQQKIEELKEYKKSLIYEYVTGKKEVI